jgi:hypothetical protein
MPSQTNSTTVKPAGTVTSKRFELPALEFKFGSLTEGTDIPPPLPSPIEEKAGPTPPDTPTAGKKQQDETKAANGKPAALASPQSQASSNTSGGGTKRPAEDSPASPTLSARPGSIRRLFSRGLLNSAYAHGDEHNNTSTGPDGRPLSPGSSSVADSSRRAKRSSGWFGRLRGDNAPANNKAAATPLSPASTTTNEKKATGPPPPMIPEISELKSKLGVPDENGFGSDLFKDIK